MYYGDKVKLRAYKKEDITLACEYMNDSEVKKLLVNKIPYPMIMDKKKNGLIVLWIPKIHIILQ